MGGVTEFLGNLNWWTLVSGAALGALGLGIRSVLQAPIKALTEQSKVIRAVWFLSPQRPFTGLWDVGWKNDHSRYQTSNVDRVPIRRLFSNFAFKTTVTLSNGMQEHCIYVGRIVDRTLTGRWFNPVDAERGYFGAFQLRLAGSLTDATGSWIGWDDEGRINSNEMTLRRVSSAPSATPSSGEEWPLDPSAG